MMHDGLMQGGLILGSARCGSTLVSRILCEHPDILSISELFASVGHNAFRPARLSGRRFWSHLARPSRAMSQVANPDAAPSEFLYGRAASPAYDPWHCPPILAVTLPHLTQDADALFDTLRQDIASRESASLADQYRGLFRAMARHLGPRRVWVERSGGSLVAAGTLCEMFREARTVLLLRNGPETALSMRDYPATRLAIWCWRWCGTLGIDLLDPRRHFGRGAFWSAVVAIGNCFGVRSIIARQPSLRDSGAFWSAVTTTGLKGLEAARPMILRYEDLCADPTPQIRKLGLHLTGSAPDEWLSRVARLPQHRQSRLASLSAAELDELRAACAPGEKAIAAFVRP